MVVFCSEYKLPYSRLFRPIRKHLQPNGSHMSVTQQCSVYRSTWVLFLGHILVGVQRIPPRDDFLMPGSTFTWSTEVS